MSVLSESLADDPYVVEFAEFLTGQLPLTKEEIIGGMKDDEWLQLNFQEWHSAKELYQTTTTKYMTKLIRDLNVGDTFKFNGVDQNVIRISFYGTSSHEAIINTDKNEGLGFDVMTEVEVCPRYRVGSTLQLNANVALDVTTIDTFGETLHYGVRTIYIVDPEEGGHPDNLTMSTGWIPVVVLDHLELIILA